MGAGTSDRVLQMDRAFSWPCGLPMESRHADLRYCTSEFLQESELLGKDVVWEWI